MIFNFIQQGQSKRTKQKTMQMDKAKGQRKRTMQKGKAKEQSIRTKQNIARGTTDPGIDSMT